MAQRINKASFGFTLVSASSLYLDKRKSDITCADIFCRIFNNNVNLVKTIFIVRLVLCEV